MIKSLLKIIKTDLEEHCNLEELKKYDISSLHFGAGMYIRNNYLYPNQFIYKTLSQYFHVDNADDCSTKILQEILK